jgi:hypothetical protein
MELHDAVAQIAEIRQQMARTATFRGYRPATTAFTGVVAIVAALSQHLLIPDPAQEPIKYVNIWVGAAIVSMVVVAAELLLWARRSGSRMRGEMTLVAAEQFAPCIVAGGLLTLVITACCGQAIWMLPGLWSILFAIGMFASMRMVGRGLILVGTFYLFAGLLLLGRGPAAAMSPWSMGITFALGQFIAALVVFFKRRKESSDEVD